MESRRKRKEDEVPDPVQVRHPESNHTSNEAPRLPALRLTSEGALNIPDPICRPITSETPCQYVTVFVFLSGGSSSSRSADGGESGLVCEVLEEEDARDRREEEDEEEELSADVRGSWDDGGGVSLA